MSNLDTKLNALTLSSLIRVLREVTLLGVSAYLAVKLFSGELSLNFSKLSASELVGLLLAFFSIALSAAFYFAATNQSNQFYDNVNKFTKDTSELLGRLDEQVKGLGGRQTELRDSIDKYYARSSSGLAKQASQNVVAKTKETEEQIQKMVAAMLDRSNLSDTERTEFVEQLKARDAELSSLRERLGRLSRRAGDTGLKGYIKRKLLRLEPETLVHTSPEQLLFNMANNGPFAFKEDLATHGYISTTELSSVDAVTPKGRELIIGILERLAENT